MDFRIAWHLFRTDVRRLRWLIALVLALMLWEASQYWLATPWDVPGLTGSLSSRRPGGNPEPVRGAFFGLAALFFSAMTGWQGLTARILRPVTRREIVVGKGLVLAVILWLPQSLAILIVLRHFGLGWPGALAGLATAAAVFVPLSLCLTAWGRLAGSFWRFLAALAVTVIILAVLQILLRGDAIPMRTAGALPLLHHLSRQHSLPVIGILFSGCAATLGLLVIAIRQWSALLRCAAAGAAILLLSYLILRNAGRLQPDFVPHDSPVDLAGIRPAVSGNLSAGQPQTSPPAERIGLNGTIVSEGLPDGVSCVWELTGSVRLTNPAGKVATSWTIPRPHPSGRSAVMDRLPAGEAKRDATAESALPPEFRRSLASGWGEGQTGDRLLATSLGIFTGDLLSLGETDLTLTTSFSGLVYRYRILADLPLTDGAEISAHGGRLLLRPVKEAGDSVYVEISLLTPASGFSQDFFAQSEDLPASMWRVFLYLPATGSIIGSAARPLNVAGPILGGGINHRVAYQFHPGPLPAGSPDALTPRVIILEPEILGRIHRELHASGLTLDVPPARQSPATRVKKPVPDNNQTRDISGFWASTFGPPVSLPDALAYTRTHRPDPATASPEEFGRWVQFCLGQFLPPAWKAGELERWVPTHLPEMIRMGRFAGPEFNTAFIRALPEDRKSEVIARLEDAPWLLGTIVARGWLEDAREPLLRLFEAGRLRTYHDLACVAALRAPETYERLIAQCDRPDAEALYLALRSIPGIEPGLADRIRQSPWLAGIPGNLTNRPARYPDVEILRRLHIRLSHGIPEAAKHAVILHQWLADGLPGTNGDQEFMEQHFALPEGVKRGSAESGAWLRQLDADDVHWDPLTRLWQAGNLRP